MNVIDDIEQALGIRPGSLKPLSGGCVGTVYGVNLGDGRKCVAKTGHMGCGLEIEGQMLTYLQTQSPLSVPEVLYCDPCLLIMDYLENDGRIRPSVEVEAADAIAALHGVGSEYFGLEFDSLIGGLHQSNKPYDNWIDFYREERLFGMADQAIQAGRFPGVFRDRLEKLAVKLPEIAPEPDHPSLLHGDLWGGNVLACNGKLTGFIDPAIYYGHAEMDLAFSTLFHSFGTAFFDRYREQRPISPGFFEERCHLYNLYPLLVHVRLFGGSYLGDVDRVLAKFGC